jgi:transketolase
MIIYDGQQDKKPYKSVFAETMEAIVTSDEDVVYIDCDLMNSFGTLGLWKKNPRQVINAGIAEANAMGIAGGLSAAGKKPYVHTFSTFASRRCFDQIFLTIGYGGNSVRILGSDAGVTAAFNGGTHMSFEDLALMRTIPDATVIESSDGVMLESMLRQVKDRPGVSYLRTSRKTYPSIYSSDHSFTIGKGQVVRDGDFATIFACGLMVSEAMKAACILEKDGVHVQVVDLFTIKPLDRELIRNCAERTGLLITAENHNVVGGLGDAVAATVAEMGLAVQFRKIGVQDRYGSVGPQDYLQEYYGLTAENILSILREMKPT